jgi:hypothetical protein
MSAADLADAFRVDPTTITRALRLLGPEAQSLGATRRTRYALRRKVMDSASTWQIYRIDPSGHARDWGTLEAFHGAWRMRWAGDPPAWISHFADPEGLWPRLPFFLAHLRPRGFLGRSAARPIARILRLPADPESWEDDHILTFLALNGQDLPGDLVIGDDCLRAALALQVTPAAEFTMAPHQAMTRYPELATRATGDFPQAALMGGQQPKFLVSLDESGTERRQVMVKFSPPMNQPLGRRWADLLAMEFHGLSILSEKGLAGTGHRLIDAGGRRFLESPRFDRSARGGRTSVVSLEALHGGSPGPIDWNSRVLDLQRAGLVDSEAVRDTRRLLAFGELIGNTDMHAGNLAFRMTDELPFTLAPAYDMLPMLWAPGPQGELIDQTFAPQPPVPADAEAWREMLDPARDFWNRVIGDQRVSREFAATARAAGESLARLAERFG